MWRPEPRRAAFHNLARRLAQRLDGVRVVGFDVFDTLLLRRIEPETVKDLAARHLAARLASAHGAAPDWRLLRHKRRLLESQMYAEAAAAGHDREFRLREMVPRWLAACGADESLANALVAHELHLERLATRPAPRIADALDAAARRGARLIFITDIYLDLDDIWDLLRHHRLDAPFARGYCSGALLKTKRAGGLFTHVLTNEGVAPTDLLFIGDNPYSDGQMPRSLGIRTLELRDAPETQRRTQLCLLGHLSHKNDFWKGQLAGHVLKAERGAAGHAASPAYALGLLLAPAFLAFALFMIEQAIERGLRRLLFFSREGLTFLRLYRQVTRAMGLRDAAPPATYVGVSRIATYLPSLDELSARGLCRLLRQYGNQPMRRLLRNLGLPVDTFGPLARRCGIADLDAPIEDPEKHVGFTRFVHDAEVQERFVSHRDQSRALLCAYLRQSGYFAGPRVGVIDIGWKGSIQDNVVRATRHLADCPEVHGLYFGLVHRCEDDVPRSFKTGYFADSKRGDWLEQAIFRNGSVFEMFSSAPHGGVIGYRRLANGHIKPVVSAQEAQRRSIRHVASDVFLGIEDCVRDYLRIAPLIPITSQEWKPYLLDQLRRYILYPTLDEARQFLKYSHVESFGVFGVSTYEFKGSWREILRGGPLHEAPRRLIGALERAFWSEAYLRRLRIPLANALYDLLETYYNGRVLPVGGEVPAHRAEDAGAGMPAALRGARVLPACAGEGTRHG